MRVVGQPDPTDGDITARRYSGELTQALRQEVRAVLVQASARDRNPPRWSRPGGAVALLVALAIGGAWAKNGRDDPRAAQASVAFSALNDVRGGRVRAEELLPVPEGGARTAGNEAPGRDAKEQDANHKAKVASRAADHRPGKAASEVTGSPVHARCTNCGKEPSGEWETIFDASRDEPLIIQAAELPARAVVNVGTRIPVTLLEAVVTGAGGAPARARVDQDVRAGPRVAVPKGAVLVGQAFATETNDRVQILLGWLVTDGKSHSLRALVLGPDNGLGLKGRVVQRTSRGRGLGGNVLGSVGRVLSFGLLAPGGTDLGSLAARDAAETVGESLRSTGQRWLVSDKVIQLPAGTSAVAYLEGDLELE